MLRAERKVLPIKLRAPITSQLRAYFFPPPWEMCHLFFISSATDRGLQECQRKGRLEPSQGAAAGCQETELPGYSLSRNAALLCAASALHAHPSAMSTVSCHWCGMSPDSAQKAAYEKTTNVLDRNKHKQLQKGSTSEVANSYLAVCYVL